MAQTRKQTVQAAGNNPGKRDRGSETDIEHPAKKKQHRAKQLNEAERKQIRDYGEANKTKSVNEIAEYLGVTYDQVRYVFKKKWKTFRAHTSRQRRSNPSA